MDIPESGAIFTLGKSHLSDDHQHFFFIKNDPVERLRCGNFESAVICKSGRCFVWGHNNYGQLGIGQICDVVAKPSCIKEIKKELLKVVDIAFGDGFSVILTNDNRLFTCGRNVLPETFKCLPSAVEIISKPVAIEDLNEDRKYSKLAAAHHQFAAYSKGKKELIICGRTRPLDKYKVKVLRLWDDINQLACGSTFTLALSKHGLLYAVGQIGEKVLPTLMRVDNPNMHFVSVHVSHKDDIYLINADGEVYKNEVELHFHKYTLIPSLHEKIVALSTGKEGVISFLTENSRFFTSFTTPKTIDSIYDYKELTKFKPMDVTQLASGHHHILVQAIRNSQKAFLTRSLMTAEHVYPPALSNAVVHFQDNKKAFKKFEIEDYVDSFMNGNAQMNNWARSNTTTTNKRPSTDELNGNIRYIPLKGTPPKLDLKDEILYQRSPTMKRSPPRFQSSFDSTASSNMSNGVLPMSDQKLNQFNDIMNEKVRRELERDDNLKIVRIADPVRGEIFHSFHQLPVGSQSNVGDYDPQQSTVHSRSMMDIRFIDNGLDVTESLKRITPYDEGAMLGERLLHPRRYNKVGCIKDETMTEILQQTPQMNAALKRTPFHSVGVSFFDPTSTRTTASMTSPAKEKPGIVKQFIMDLKRVPEEFSCKKDYTTEGHKNTHPQSEICTIL